ncbi:hypothetical protein NDU88_002400 [Pleurodeles waltl]|uniref:Uncharacterized protein n=1 Tax=Pleurodeles waltl TaxID=8319 RepID=A0AAV7Q988_PLEWA|nr:hypothetical protein NDU88_002400 [Pleurodeles waltl]
MAVCARPVSWKLDQDQFDIESEEKAMTAVVHQDRGNSRVHCRDGTPSIPTPLSSRSMTQQYHKLCTVHKQRTREEMDLKNIE